MRTRRELMRAWMVAVVCVALGCSSAGAAEFWLEARPLVASEYPPGVPSTVPMWGYASCDMNWVCGAAAVPGPQLVVPAGDTTGLTVHLKNSLPAVGLTVPNMTSLVIPGQRDDDMAPQMFPPEPNPHDNGLTTRRRMRSFTHETPQGGIGTYTWSTLRPGTYLYHSGTHVQVQVQMGLYGSVKADAAPGQAYLGHAYTTDVTLLFSEIDPVLHAEVANGTYGTPGHPTSTINYRPTYFLINGAPYAAATLPLGAGPAGQRTLLRLVNAGLDTHVPVLLGGHFRVIAEDGNPLPYEREQYEAMLAAGKTLDAIWVPAATGTYAVFDRRNHQGMVAKLAVGGTGAAPTAVSDVYSTPVDTPLSVGAPGVLANDTNPTATLMTATVVTGPARGALAFNSNGSFVYTPDPGFFGPITFTYKANNGADSNVATVTILVNRPPLAVNDTATTQPGMAVTVNVLANDSDPENQPLAITGVTPGTNGTVAISGTSVVYTPNAGFTGTDTFTYTISDGQVPTPGTATGTVTVTVAGNSAPTATPDSATVAEDGTTTIAVLANDSDPEMQPLTVTGVTNGANGTVTTNGTTVTYKPNANFNGTDTFTYTISDGQTPPGTATGTVTVTVTPVNDAPVAVANTYAVNKQTVFTVPAPGVLANDTDVDGDPLTASPVTNLAGAVLLNPDGSFTYTTAASYVGTRVFKYKATDGQLNSAVVTVTVIKDLTVQSITRATNGDWIIKGKSTKPRTMVEVFANPTPGVNSLGTVPVGGNGNWVLRVPGGALVSGQQMSVKAPYAELIEVPVP